MLIKACACLLECVHQDFVLIYVFRISVARHVLITKFSKPLAVHQLKVGKQMSEDKKENNRKNNIVCFRYFSVYLLLCHSFVITYRIAVYACIWMNYRINRFFKYQQKIFGDLYKNNVLHQTNINNVKLMATIQIFKF